MSDQTPYSDGVQPQNQPHDDYPPPSGPYMPPPYGQPQPAGDKYSQQSYGPAQYQQPQWGQQPPNYPQQQQMYQPPQAPLYERPSSPQPQWQPPPPQWQQQPLQGNAGQPMYAPQMQQPMYSYPPVQQVMMPQQIVNVNIQQHQHGLFMRALYFIFIGWWAGLIWLNIGYFFVLTIIGLPLGLVMLNRLPTVMTLKPASQSVNISMTGGTTNINIGGAQQVSFLIRALYFIFIGWWAGLVWSWVAYALFIFIVTIPVGVMMFNILPTVITLRKN